MKKVLLTLFVALAATTMYAQERVSSVNREVMHAMPQMLDMATAATPEIVPFDEVAKAPKRSKDTGLYYYKPYGSLYDAWTNEYGGVYYATYVIVPPFDDFTYINMSYNPTACQWWIGNDYNYTEYADSLGNLTLELYPGYGYFQTGGDPLLKLNGETYAIGYYYPDYGPYVMVNGDIDIVGFVDNKQTGSLGALSTGYMGGTGTYTGDMSGVDINGNDITAYGTYTCTHVSQSYPAPASPLYVESIYLEGMFKDNKQTETEPIKNDAELTLEICDYYTGEVLETLTATTGCYTSWGYTYDSSFNYYNVGLIKFNKWGDDPLFGKTLEPIVIDRATTCNIRGFENSDIDFGIRMNYIKEWDGDEELTAGRVHYSDPTGTMTPNGHRYASSATGESCAVNLKFEGFMDKAYIEEYLYTSSGWSYDQFNILQMLDDGSDCNTYGLEDDSDHNLGALYITTACPWFDDYYNENYYFDDLPDWITGIYVNDYYYDPENLSFVNYVWFVGDPLPSDVDGRIASFKLNGRGYTTDNYAIVVQGNADPTGIESVAAEIGTTVTTAKKGTYNLAGQRVSDSAKGLLIRDGKKVFSK